ncbi:hypothetical protein Cfla_2932 [Cellulomonas flavigena DSM 20109]|uniref:Uncharacterized protein n=1 Tax=Cellulomonas flavigena (strain ATCC 482 / DSM 20109 / BCRC 11376 / JCM 18109 / NBRC 3775 / NCIMB 8073 / NRS 134) TaxID=446466 RepID=D5UKF4_CELFN|nr:hypothetical protein [Cellulomonas flavigena]ADG75815.1 hypothetical protein Cfla_2932 [Cellulomonas flavigena DSM 20109]
MTLIKATDDDFRVCRIDFTTLVNLQRAAEEFGWSTRWTSVEALQSQVADSWILLQTFLRQRAADGQSMVRCFLLFATKGDGLTGGVTTLDVDPAALRLLDRIDTDPVVRSAMMDMFLLATGGIAMVTKR